MVSIAFIIYCTLTAETLLHLVAVWVLARKLRLDEPARAEDSRLPKAGVVISLRGADPGLGDCLRGLLDQDYPQYRVEIVVDSERDPAWQIAHDIVRETRSTHARISLLAIRGMTRSLKCSSLLQGVGALDDSHQIIAFCDADVVPHRTWLRELAAPLLDPQVGAATGNRWYAGPRRQFGSLARCAWNAGAVAQMLLFGIPWGGSLAIRRETFVQAGIGDKWKNSFNDDLVVGEQVRNLGLDVRFVPSLVMVERGESSLPNVCQFVFRQMFHMRFYHRSWPTVAGFGLLTAAQPPIALLLLAFALAQNEWEAACWSGGGLAAHVAMLGFAFYAVESAINRTLNRYGRSINPLGARTLWCTLLAAGTFGTALVQALTRRTVTWRGVIYHVSAPWQVELVSYQTTTDRLPAVSPAPASLATDPIPAPAESSKAA